MKIHPCLAIFAGLFLTHGLPHAGEQLWSGQKAPPARLRSELERIMGPAEAAGPLAKPLHICFVWGYDNYTHDPSAKVHPVGTHEFRKVKDLALGLLSKVQGVKVDSAFYFPSKKQWDSADLVIWYLQPDNFVDSNFAYVDKFQARGGSMILLHDACIMNFKTTKTPNVQDWANRTGMSYKFNGTNTSLYGPTPTPQMVRKETGHPIVENFRDTLDWQDELYWNLVPAADTATLTALITSQAGAQKDSPPLPSDQMPAKQWPFVWVYEKGPGKVFCASVLHNLWTFNDPLFRILFFRAIAWESGESFAPFRSLVTDGVTVVEDVSALAPVSANRKAGRSARGWIYSGKPHKVNGARLPEKTSSEWGANPKGME